MQQVQTQEQTQIISSSRETLVSVRGLVKHFPVEGSDEVVRAVDGVSFDIYAGETLGLSVNPVAANRPSDVVYSV